MAEPTEKENITTAPRRFFAGFIPRWLLSLTVVAATVGAVGNFVRVPYHSLGPGPAVDVLSLIRVEGAPSFPSQGKLLLTTASVSGRALTVWDAVRVWLDPSLTVVDRAAIVPDGRTDLEQDVLNRHQMEESKLDAEVAAFRAVGRRAAVVPGARVLTVVEDSPAHGKLREKDLIVAVDGARVTSPEAVIDAIQAKRVGQRVTLTVRRDGKQLDVTIRTGEVFGKGTPNIGVTLATAYELEREVGIDTQDIGGPSGGLVFALSIVDRFTPEDLTGGHVIAATGTITLDDAGVARVGPIGAVHEKVRSARQQGADIFLASPDDAEAARRVAPPSMRVIGVATLDEALRALRALPPLRRAA